MILNDNGSGSLSRYDTQNDILFTLASNDRNRSFTTDDEEIA